MLNKASGIAGELEAVKSDTYIVIRFQLSTDAIDIAYEVAH